MRNTVIVGPADAEVAAVGECCGRAESRISSGRPGGVDGCRSRCQACGCAGAWSTNRDQPLAQAFKTVTGVDDELFRTLESLAGAHLKTHQDDLRQSLSELNAQKLTENLLTAIDDHALRTTLGATFGCESTTPMDEIPGGASLGFWMRARPMSKDERFQSIRQHAKGGIGQVWFATRYRATAQRGGEGDRPRRSSPSSENQAERGSSSRRKSPETWNTPESSRCTAWDETPTGRPYYAMRFIRGESTFGRDPAVPQ